MESTTGIEVSQRGIGSWIDGARDLIYSAGQFALAREFPEQYTNAGAGEVVRDTVADAELGANSLLTADNAVRLGLVAAAIIAAVIVAKKL